MPQALKNAADPEDENHKSHFMREFTGKMLRPRSNMFCASLCSRNAHGRVTTAMLCENLQVKMLQTKVARQTLCEPAQSKCTHAEMYAGEQIEHSDQAPALTPTVRTLRCGHTVWGKKRLQETSHNWKNCWMVETN